MSARTGAGLAELRAALERTAAGIASRAQADGPARLHVDRVFTIRGAGTVATGTLWAGTIARGGELVRLPEERRVRVREVQVHGEPVAIARAGQRVAVNLASIATADLHRGDVLVSPGAPLAPARVLDAELTFPGREPEHAERVQIHHGTRECSTRVTWLGGRFWQLRLEQPLLAARGDRLVVRQLAPPDTLGGGTVLDPAARRHGPGRDALARLERLSRGEPEPGPAETAPAAAPGPSRRRTGGTTTDPADAPAQTLKAGARTLEARLRAAGLEPPADSELDADDLAALRAAGRAVRVSRTLHYHAAVLAETRARIVAAAERRGGSISLAELRDELGTSRRFAQALLEHFDSERVTIRRGERHVLRRRPEPVTPGPPVPR